MAQTLANGVVIPAPGDRISAQGVAEMRTLGASVDSGLSIVRADNEAGLADARAWTLDQLEGIATAYDVAVEQGFDGNVGAWLESLVGPQGDEGPYGGTEVTDPQVAALLATRQSDTQTVADGRYLGQGSLAVSADTYGTAADGEADDTAALQAALDSGARFVYVPTGVYRISAPLRVPANTVFYTFSATLVSDAPDLGTFITAYGSYLGSSRRPLAMPVNSGGRTLTTANAHNYQPGDILRLVSQRISTNPTDAGEDQLGWSTGSGAGGPFFSEFVRVQNVTDTTVTIDNGLLFNGYRPDKSQETDPTAGEHAYLIKTDGMGDNVLISGFRLEGEASYGVRVLRAKNARIRDVEWVREEAGRFIQFVDCYYSDAERCYIETRQWTEPDTEGGVDHAAINQYHVMGSWQTGFTDCRSVRGTQPYDFTYGLTTAPYPSVFCYVRNSSAEGNLFNPVTAHPGTYGIVVEGNVFSDCQRSGISIRSNGAQVVQNIVRGSGTGLGLYITEGGGKESLIVANTVERFDVGLSVNDGASKIFSGWIGVTFSSNSVIDCQIGYQRYLGWQRPLQETAEGIVLRGNSFISDRPSAVGVDTGNQGRAAWGLTVQDNTFRLTGSGFTTGVRLTNNSRGVSVLGNTFWEAFYALTLEASGTSAAWPEAIVTDYTGNVLHDVTGVSVPANTQTWRLRSEDSTPHLVASPNLDLYTETVTIKAMANADVNAGNNFPVSNTACIVEVKRWDSVFAVQQVTTTAGDMHQRRRSVSSWGSWSKRH